MIGGCDGSRLLAEAIQGSNSIEGYDVNEDDAIAAVKDEGPLDADPQTWAEIVGYRTAMSYVLQLADDPHVTLDPSLLRSLHYMLLSHDVTESPGRYRSGPIFIRDERADRIVYEGPACASVPALVDGLLTEIRSAQPDLPVYGRMARCLQTLVLSRVQPSGPPHPGPDRPGPQCRDSRPLERCRGARGERGAALMAFLRWCAARQLAPLEAKRPHLELYPRWMEQEQLTQAIISRRFGTVAGFFRYAVVDGHLADNPALVVTRPRVSWEGQRRTVLDPLEYAALLTAARHDPAARPGATSDPRRDQGPGLAKTIGIEHSVSPHSLRRTFCTAGLISGVPLRDMQYAMRHADTRTTMRYDMARANLDRHAAHPVAAYLAGMAMD